MHDGPQLDLLRRRHRCTIRANQGERSQLHRELIRELDPRGAVENILVAGLAHRAANMEWLFRATCAVRDTAPNLLADLAGLSRDACTALATAASFDALVRAERTSTGQSRAFARDLKLLQDLQARRLRGETKAPPTIAANSQYFLSEQTCVEQLIFSKRRHYRCDGCGAAQAHLLPSRNCFECVACGSQSGLRAGTVMTDSPLPLTSWFTAILIVLDRPNIATAELQHQLGLTRPATARAMVNKIRARADGRQPFGAAGWSRYVLRST